MVSVTCSVGAIVVDIHHWGIYSLTHHLAVCFGLATIPQRELNIEITIGELNTLVITVVVCSYRTTARRRIVEVKEQSSRVLVSCSTRLSSTVRERGPVASFTRIIAIRSLDGK